MDTPQFPATDSSPFPGPDQTATTASRADEAHLPDPETDVVEPRAPETGQSEAESQPQRPIAPQDAGDAPETDDEAAQRASAAARTAEGVDPSEGNAGSFDTEAVNTAFDPAAFDEALKQVLSSAGGELLFRFTENSAVGEKVAAVRLGDGEARLIALVILPPHGDPLRVEPVEESANPLAALAKSYASLIDAWKAAA